MPWKMFLIEPSGLCRLSLRRFCYLKRTIGDTNVGFKDVVKPCPIGNDRSHDASAVIAEQVPDESGRHHGKEGFEADPRWPVKCASCSYVFEADDFWQVNYDPLWKGSLDGKLYVLRKNPPGATWHADWFPDTGPNGPWSGPDGKVWCVMLPGGMEWIIYSYASGPDPRHKWNVQGALLDITVTPSINCVGYYHGFVSRGVISEDCEGRKYDGVPRTA